MTGIANLLYGWHRYTDVWGQQRRSLTGWAHNPAKTLIRFSDDLARFPDLDIAIVDVMTDLVLENADPLDPVNTITAALYDFYSMLDQALTDSPNLTVSVLSKAMFIAILYVIDLLRVFYAAFSYLSFNGVMSFDTKIYFLLERQC